MSKNVVFPVFELVGPPCEAPDCKGVLVDSVCLKTRDCFKRCSVCKAEFYRETAAEVSARFKRLVDRIEKGVGFD